MAGPARAQTAAGPGRTRVSVNAGMQLVSTTFDASTRQEVHLETATINSTYQVTRAPFIDGGAAIFIRNGFGVGLVGSWRWKGLDATIEAAIPHPFFFNSPRAISGAPSELSRDERVVHVQAVYLIRPTKRVDLVVGGGPSFFSVTQTLVTEVSFNEAYPYDSATFAGAASTEFSGHQVGFNIGADVGLRLGPSVGVGGLVRLSHAKVGFALPNGVGNPSVDAGGLQLGGGLRLYF